MKWWVISVGSVVCVVATGTYFYVKVQKNKISRESKEEEKSIEQVVEEKEFEKFQDVEEVVEKKCRNYEEYDDDEKIEFIAPPKIRLFAPKVKSQESEMHFEEMLRKGTFAKKFTSRNWKTMKIWVSQDLKRLNLGTGKSDKSPQISIPIAEIVDILNGASQSQNPQQTITISAKRRPRVYIEFDSCVVKSNWKSGLLKLVQRDF